MSDDAINPTREQIERRAYELYLERGCKPGGELEDWLKAETELILEHEFGMRVKRLPRVQKARTAVV